MPKHHLNHAAPTQYSAKTMGVDMIAGTVTPKPTRHTSHHMKEGVKAVAIPKVHCITRYLKKAGRLPYLQHREKEGEEVCNQEINMLFIKVTNYLMKGSKVDPFNMRSKEKKNPLEKNY